MWLTTFEHNGIEQLDQKANIFHTVSNNTFQWPCGRDIVWLLWQQLWLPCYIWSNALGTSLVIIPGEKKPHWCWKLLLNTITYTERAIFGRDLAIWPWKQWPWPCPRSNPLYLFIHLVDVHQCTKFGSSSPIIKVDIANSLKSWRPFWKNPIWPPEMAVKIRQHWFP